VWNIVWKDGVQQLEKAAGSAPQPDQILIHNESNRVANPGIGMAGQGSVYKRTVFSGSSAQFQVTPTYWFGLFINVEVGEVISHNVIIGPLQLVYPSGLNAATVTATLDGDTIHLSVVYGSQMYAAVENVEKRIEALTEFRGRPE
jgi:hypothetical protein